MVSYTTYQHCKVIGSQCYEFPECELENQTLLDHPLIRPTPEREIMTPNGVIRLVWLEDNLFGAWQSCGGKLSHLAEEQPDGSLKFLETRDFQDRYYYVQWLATRIPRLPTTAL